jgi:D-alanyl-D-alanine carboxypeptidase/D-alanyl-D-alanine-endopeptidase (penicillin-binding protein 4)
MIRAEWQMTVKVHTGLAERTHMPQTPARRPLRRPRALVALAAAAGCLAPLAIASPSAGAVSTSVSTTVPAAYALTSADRRMATNLSRRITSRTFALGSYVSGTVVDVDSNAVVWSYRGTTGRMPASTAKLVTATNALSVLGPDHRFTTVVRRSSDWRTLVLDGAGDPSLSSSDLSVLARDTAAAVKAHGRGYVHLKLDDSIFPKPTLAEGWKSSYVPTDVRWVRGLVVDGHHVTDTSLDAAKVFAAKLKYYGVSSTLYGRAVVSSSPVVASVQGDRLADMVQYMMLVSDNDHAEALHRLVAREMGYATTWTESGLAQRVRMRRDGIVLPYKALRDGSGLSRSDRLSTNTLAAVVRNILEPGQDDLAPLRDGGLPVAGRTGTLASRFTTSPSSCAAGRVTAKTGTLSDAAALAGWTTGRDGRLKAFAFVVNYKRADLNVRRHLDALAATVNGCY